MPLYQKIISLLKSQIKALFELKQTERLWHIPLLASICVGIPLLAGLYFGRLNYGILSCIGGLVILYLPTSTLAVRMITLLACSFGFMLSFTIGIIFSYNNVLAALVLGLFTFMVVGVVNYFDMKPPGSFFFTMIASIAICAPFNLSTIPVRVGLMGLGSMHACIWAFVYSLYITRKRGITMDIILDNKPRYEHFWKAVVLGTFTCISLAIAHGFHLNNPYWVPVSCLAVMQGVNVTHVWERTFQRILGTFTGMGLTWGILLLGMTPLSVSLTILILQFIIEMLVVRHYALAVVFITPMTVLMAEASSAMTMDPTVLIKGRLLDIVIGSIIGAIGGWFLYHKEMRDSTHKQIRKTRISLLRKKRK